MKYLKWMVYAGLVGSMQGAIAQQLPVMNHYIYNPYLYNPARTGQNPFGSININFKKQWVDLPYSPITGSLSVEAPLPVANMGLGGMLYSDRMHIINKLGGMLSYAYHVPFSKEYTHRLSGGLSLGFINQRFDFQEATVGNPNDNQILPTEANATAFDFSLGLDYQWKDLHVGLSMLQGLNNQMRFLSNARGEVTYLNTRHFLMNTSYRFKFGEGKKLFYVEPNVLLRMIQGLPVQVEFNALAGWKDLLWGGIGYRSSNNETATSALMATFGVELQKRLFLAYTFEFAVDGKLNASLGSQHEVMLAYRFGDGLKDKRKEEEEALRRKALEEQLQTLNKRNEELEERMKAGDRRVDSLAQANQNLAGKVDAQANNQAAKDAEMKRQLEEQQALLEAQKKALDKQAQDIEALRKLIEANRYAYKKLGEVYFPEAGTTLDKESMAKLDALKMMLDKNHPKTATIYLLGFGSKTGDAKMNERISTQRTLAVRQYLINKGVSGDRLIIVPNGKTDSPGANNTEDRRVDILISEQ